MTRQKRLRWRLLTNRCLKLNLIFSFKRYSPPSHAALPLLPRGKGGLRDELKERLRGRLPVAPGQIKFPVNVLLILCAV